MAMRNWDSWPAQEPPAEFADRAVTAMLRAQRAGIRGRLNRRWVVGLSLAAVLAAAGAWGMVRAVRPSAPRLPSAVPEAPSASAEASTPAPPRVVLAPAADSAPKPAPSATAAPAPVRPKPSASASAMPPAPSASAPVKKIIVPRCECAPKDGICTCVQ